MSPAIVTLIVFAVYIIGYKYYAGFLGSKLFNLRADFKTPAHTKRDNIDFIPTPTYILWGHHYASIAGLSPILGPAVAVIWGWLPALLWVVLGSVLIGAVHDFAALVLSVRANGLSIGSITEHLMGRRAKLLFLLIIFFLFSLAMGVFVLVLGYLFSAGGFPQVIAPSTGIMVIAMIMGYLYYKKNIPLKYMGVISFFIVLLFLWWGQHPSSYETFNFHDTQKAPSITSWKIVMLCYGFAASILPVWLLLQSRDFLNSLLLYLSMGLLYIGFFLSDVSFSAPAVQFNAANAPPVFPFLFIVIACGAISGFHSLVSSGTTAKQLNKETDAKIIGYGGMIGESMLGLIAILATTTTFASFEEWNALYCDWNQLASLGKKVGIFIEGGAKFLSSTGISIEFGKGLLAFVVVSFALTSLDSATRLLRYNIEEMATFIKEDKIRRFFQNRYISSFLAVLAIGFFAFFEIKDASGNSLPAGKVLWQLFGTTNQILGALALFLASIYLYSRKKNPLYTLIPMIFVLFSTIIAMIENIILFIEKDGMADILVVAVVLLVITVWLLYEASMAIIRYKNKKTDSLDIIIY
ncbi:MAG: carbon starvation protein A [Spirochaetia bacterium]|nr:carbon starvation protein A [Spirochaetia bacterium]